MEKHRRDYISTSSERFRNSKNKYHLFLSPKHEPTFNINELTKISQPSEISKRNTCTQKNNFKKKNILQLLETYRRGKDYSHHKNKQHKTIVLKEFIKTDQNNIKGIKFRNSQKQNHEQDSQCKYQSQMSKTIKKLDNCCHLTILMQSNKQIHLEIQTTTIQTLLNDLSKQIYSLKPSLKCSKEIVGFETANRNLKLDYYLTCIKSNAQFLNGKRIILRPVYKQPQQQINLHSFDIIQCIGTGGFSKVYLCKFKEDGRYYAMKVIDKAFIVKNKKKKIVANQRNIMVQLNHPLIAKLYFSFESENNLIFVMEYYPGGQLFGLVKRFRKMDEHIAKFYIIEILLSLEEVHSNGIVYRDFKPENILIDSDGHAYIADFGLAKPNITSIQKRAYSFCGSPEYMPPEMIAKNGHSLPVDFYCLGALLYELVTGLPPFYDKEPEKIYHSTINQPITFPKHAENLSNNLKQLLKGLLNKDQRRRIGSLFGVKQILAHPWFGKIDKNSYLAKKVKPPVNFNTIEDLHFNSDEMKADNEVFMKEMLKNQRQSVNEFVRVMSNFYFDRRHQQQSIPLITEDNRYDVQSSPKNQHNEGLKINKRFFRKRKTENSPSSSRKYLNTSSEKYRKGTINIGSCMSMERLFRKIHNV